MHDQYNRWRLVEKQLAGEASEEESKQLQAVLNEEPYLTALMMDLTHLWDRKENHKILIPESTKNNNRAIP